MNSEMRLSLTFGDFSCDIVGYEEPFSVLARVIDVFMAARKAAPDIFDADRKAGSPIPKRFADALAQNAAAADLTINEVAGRFVVEAPGTARPAAERRPLNIAPAFGVEAVANEPDADESPIHTAGLDLAPQAPVAPELEVEAETEVAAEAPQETPVADVGDAPEVEPEVVVAALDPSPVETPVEVAAPEAAEVTAEEEEPAPSKEPAPVEEAPAEDVTAREAPKTETADDDLWKTIADYDALVAGLDAMQTSPIAGFSDLPPVATPVVAAPAAVVADRKEETPAEEAPAEKPAAAPEAAEPQATEQAAQPAAEEPARPPKPRIVVERAARAETRRRPEISVEVKRPKPAYVSARRRDRMRGTVSDNFLFDDVAPAAEDEAASEGALKLTAADAVRPAPEPEAPKPAPRKRGPLGFNFFRRKSREPEEEAAPPRKADAGFDRLRETAEASLPILDDAASEFEPDIPVEAPAALRPATPAPAPAPAPKMAETARRDIVDEDFDDGDDFEDADDEVETPAFAARAAARAAVQDEADDDPIPDRDEDEDEAETLGEDAASPAVFARRMGAQSLQDLLEASAAYMAIVEGKAKFSRRDVMQALSDIGIEKEYTPEARLKSFRKLVTSGAIVRAEDGMFAISHATRFGYETQLRSG